VLNVNVILIAEVVSAQPLSVHSRVWSYCIMGMVDFLSTNLLLMNQMPYKH